MASKDELVAAKPLKIQSITNILTWKEFDLMVIYAWDQHAKPWDRLHFIVEL